MSISVNYHVHKDEQLPVRVKVRETGQYIVRVGEWPEEVVLFLTADQAETLRKAIQSAQDDEHYSKLANECEICAGTFNHDMDCVNR